MTREAITTLERDIPRCLDELDRLPAAEGGGSLQWAVERLAQHRDLQIHLLRSWSGHERAEVRRSVVAAAASPIDSWRPAAGRLVPLLASRLSDRDRDVRYWAACHLAGAGRAAAPVADELWALIRREPGGNATPAGFALVALCRLQDPRAAALLASRLTAKPVDFSGLRAAIRLVGPWAEACREPLIRLIPAAPPGNDRIAVMAAAGRLHTLSDTAATRRLVSALRKQLRAHPHITTRVLGDIGPPAAGALAGLRRLRNHEDPVVRVNAARAVWRISADADTAITVLRSVIVNNAADRSHALAALGEMGRAGGELRGLLPAMFDSNDTWVSVRSAIAYWHLTGDPEPVLPLLMRNLRATPVGFEVVRCLADIGPAAQEATPTLQHAVNSADRQMEIGSVDPGAFGDEEWVETCAAALERIA